VIVVGAGVLGLATLLLCQPSSVRGGNPLDSGPDAVIESPTLPAAGNATR
jgi:hypothetical protein